MFAEAVSVTLFLFTNNLCFGLSTDGKVKGFNC